MTLTQLGLSVIELFKNTEFQNWFFWTGVIFLIIGGPAIVIKNNHKCNCGCKK